MLLNIIQLSLRSIHRTEFLKIVDTRLTTKYRYTRWVSRKHVAIVNEDELLETNDTQAATSVKLVSETYKNISRRPKKKPKIRKEADHEDKETTVKESIYTALKEDDKLISSLMVDVKTRKRREKNKQILLEGYRLILDALQAGAVPKVIFFNKLSDVLSLSLPKEAKLYKVPYRTIQLWSNLTTSPGVLGIFDTPDVEAKQPPNDALPLTIICDNVREPGNLGTIIRSAAAVGCEKLLLMKGCVDLWEPKVLRSAVGAHFRLPIFTSLSWDEIPTLISNESKILLADNNITYKNELKDPILESNTGTFTETDYIDTKEDYSDAHANHDGEIDETNVLTNKQEKPTAKTKLLVKKLTSQLPIVPYYTLNYTQRETVLVIGGETDGVSLQSCELLRTRNCTRVNIPLTNEVDSLNTGVAVGIVAFEIKRQFLLHKIDDE